MINYKEVVLLAETKGYLSSERFLNANGFRMLQFESLEVQLLELTLIQKWLRDEHKRIVLVIPFVSGSGWYGFQLDKKQYNSFGKSWESYEEALLNGINEALKLI